MEDKETKILSFEVSAEQAKAVSEAARKTDISVSEYLRRRLLNLSQPLTENCKDLRLAENPVALLRYALYLLQRIFSATLRVPYTLDQLNDEQLCEIADCGKELGIELLATLEEKMAGTEARLAEYLKAGKANVASA
jgi:hypothetical protein